MAKLRRVGLPVNAGEAGGFRLSITSPDNMDIDLAFKSERKGELVVVPVGLDCEVTAPQQLFASDGADPVLETIWELVHEGWQVTGRLHTTLIGCDAEHEFWRKIPSHLGPAWMDWATGFVNL